MSGSGNRYQDNRGDCSGSKRIADISRLYLHLQSTTTTTSTPPWRLEVSLSGIRAGVQASHMVWVNFDDVTGEMVLHVIREQFCMPVSFTTANPGARHWAVETGLIQRFW